MKGLFSILGAALVLCLLLVSSACVVPASAVERDVVYCSCHGMPLTMDIYYPKAGSAPVPVIVYVHGGGWYSGDKTTGTGQQDIPGLLGRGYVVAAVNYRLAPKYKFPAQIEDLKCAIRFLRANATTYDLDPTRFGVLGSSAGGHLATLLGLTDENSGFDSACDCVKESTQVQAVVDMFGPVDLTLTFERDRSPLLEHVFGTSDPESEIVRRASPLTYVSSNAPPFLIIHGEKDDQVLLDQSEALYGKLVSTNVPVNLIVVKNSGHSFVPLGGPISPTRAEVTNLVGDFFDKYLKQH